MTFKRIMLVVLPLLAAIFVYFALRVVYRDWESSFVVTPMPDGTAPGIPAGLERMTVQHIEHEVSENINLVRKDRNGRIEMRFLADRLVHKAANSSDIDRPRIQFYTKAGEIITLLADHASMVSKGPVTNFNNIESGVLWGNVIMVHDRGTPDDRSDDILAEMEDLKFSGDMSELTTDGPIVMSGIDMMLTARKMAMTVDRKTRRISTMRFMEDIRITLATGDRMSIGLPAPVAAGSPPPAAPPPAAPKAVAPMPVGAGVPATPPTPVDSGETWRIDLTGNVDGRQGDQRIQCERLGLYNRPGKSGPPAPAGAKSAAPATDVEGAAPGAPAAAPAKSKRGSAGPRAREGTAAARVLRPDAPPPLIIMAAGPLVITPVNSDERKQLGDAVDLVVATGAPVVVDDSQTRVVGSEVQYNVKSGSGSVLGKESPILLEQPGRLRLTGRRLDFDRSVRADHPFATADVQGEGQLFAQTQGMSFSGKTKKPAAADAPPAPPEPPAPPTPLEASWMRGMHLEFFQLPTDSSAGMGEIRKAAFSGQAVVKQVEGTMKGDELAIDFSKSQPGRGQSVDRLVGHGDVFIKNQPQAAPPAPAPAAVPAAVPVAGAAPAKGTSKMAIGDIACQDLDMVFERDAAGDSQPHELKAKGAVEINDPSGKIRAEDLLVKFAPAAKGGVEPAFFEAFGNVLVDREDLHAEGDHVRRDLASGMLLLEGKPARAAQKGSRVVGPRIEFNQTEGTAIVRGAGELEMPSTTDLRGRQRKQAEPLLVQWKNSMLFVDKRNFAQFDGAATATTGASRLSSERLWIYFADKPPAAPKTDAAGHVVPAATVAVAEVGPAAATPPKAAKAKGVAGLSGNETDPLFGRKALVRLFAEKNAHAIEQQWDENRKLRFTMEMIGDNLTYVDDSRKAYIRGPGRLRILAREKPKPGEPERPGLAPEGMIGVWTGAVPDGYSRTEVAWAESMAYDGATDRAYFKGDVETVHTGRSTPGAAAQSGAARAVRLESADLQAIFSEKPAPAAAGAAPLPDVPREERMAVEKLLADGGVKLWVDDRRGTCERLVYQRVPEEIRLYRGMDDWARLWQENEASQEFGEIVARVIAFEPASGRVNVVEQQSITLSQKPKANPTGKSAPKPMFKP